MLSKTGEKVEILHSEDRDLVVEIVT
jgi:hypothetical protein